MYYAILKGTCGGQTGLLNEIQSRETSWLRAPFRSPVFAGLGLRNARRVLEKLDDWISLSGTVHVSNTENDDPQKYQKLHKHEVLVHIDPYLSGAS